MTATPSREHWTMAFAIALSAALTFISTSALMAEARQVPGLMAEVDRACGHVPSEALRLTGVVLLVGVFCAGSAVVS